MAAFMERMPFRLDPDAPVRTLAAGEKQKLEILKQLYLGSAIIILDEPTSVLTPDEADEVLGLLRDMTRRRRADHPDDQPQVSRGDQVRRRGHHPAARPAGGAGAGGGAVHRRDGAPDGRRRAAARRSPARRQGAGRVVLEIRGLHANDDLGAPAVRDLRCACAPARSWASPASRATGRRSWWRCWPGSVSRSGGEIVRGRRALPRAARRRCASRRCVACPTSRCATPAWARCRSRRTSAFAASTAIPLPGRGRWSAGARCGSTPAR